MAIIVKYSGNIPMQNDEMIFTTAPLLSAIRKIEDVISSIGDAQYTSWGNPQAGELVSYEGTVKIHGQTHNFRFDMERVD